MFDNLFLCRIVKKQRLQRILAKWMNICPIVMIYIKVVKLYKVLMLTFI